MSRSVNCADRRSCAAIMQAGIENVMLVIILALIATVLLTVTASQALAKEITAAILSEGIESIGEVRRCQD